MTTIRSLLAIFGRKSVLFRRNFSSNTSMFDTKYPQKNINKHRPFTVVVEGNIGSGKTTLLSHLNNKDACILAEPVDMWRDCCGVNLLDLMYQNPKKWAFTFQSYVQLTMMKLHLQATNKPLKFMERSIYSARFCFVENVIQQKILEMPSALVIDEWFKWIINYSDLSVDLIIYLRTSPEVAFERMKNRNRSEENTVPLEYLRQLHDLHEQWLVEKSKFDCQIPVIIVNGDLDLKSLGEEYKKLVPFILNKAEQRKIAFNF